MTKIPTALIIFTLLHAMHATAHGYNSLSDMYKGLAASRPHQYLNAHNKIRQELGVPPLQWDEKLEAHSRRYAKKQSHYCRLRHSHGPYGENLAWDLYEERTPTQIVQTFIDERVHYDLVKGVCNCPPSSDECMCGHFTQVIWKTTQRVGCAEATCKDEKGRLVVCSYDPRGNVAGHNPLHP